MSNNKAKKSTFPIQSGFLPFFAGEARCIAWKKKRLVAFLMHGALFLHHKQRQHLYSQ